jgi:hypothetical protein
LPPWSVVQTGAASEGLLRQWPEPDAGVSKHYGYAFQWFGLCALVALLYLWFQILRPLRRASLMLPMPPESSAPQPLGLTVHSLPEAGVSDPRAPAAAAGRCWPCCWSARPR